MTGKLMITQWNRITARYENNLIRMIFFLILIIITVYLYREDPNRVSLLTIKFFLTIKSSYCISIRTFRGLASLTTIFGEKKLVKQIFLSGSNQCPLRAPLFILTSFLTFY